MPIPVPTSISSFCVGWSAEGDGRLKEDGRPEGSKGTGIPKRTDMLKRTGVLKTLEVPKRTRAGTKEDDRLALNMTPPNKRPHSPGASDNIPRKRTKILARARALANPPRRRRRGPKDDPIFELEKIAKRRRYPILSTVPRQLDTLYSIQPTTSLIVPIVESHQPHQHIVSIAVPDRPSPPPNDYIGVDEYFNNTPVRPDTEAQSGSFTAANMLRNNGTHFHQTSHLDRPSSTWNIRRNNQATQWRSVVIPQLIAVYLANRAQTESGRVPASPKPPHQCKCERRALEIEFLDWDRKFSRRSYFA